LGDNREAKTEILKAINTDPLQLEALKKFAQKGSRHRSVLASALGSAMRGAGWTRKAVGGDATKLCKNAMIAFLDLCKNGILSETTRQEVIAKLSDGKSSSEEPALPGSGAPFWTATQQLSLEERTQVADCLGPLPPKAYAQSREGMQISMELEALKAERSRPFRGGGPLCHLNGLLMSVLGENADLQYNGCQLPDPIPAQIKPMVEEELTEPGVRPAFERSQAFHQEHSGRMRELGARAATLNLELQSYVDDKSGDQDLMSLVEATLGSEKAMRRSLFAGTPDVRLNPADVGIPLSPTSPHWLELVIVRSGGAKQPA
jgi:hypothetical protein